MKDFPAKIRHIANPLLHVDEDDLDWLELGNIPDRVYNPLLDRPILEDPVEDIVKVFMNPDYISFACKMILNIEIPPYQAVILDTLWRKNSPMLIGSRGAAKSYILSVYCLLRMVLNPGCRIVIVGAGLRQSRQVFDYMTTIWNKSDILQDMAGRSKTAGPRFAVDRYQFEIGDSRCYAIPIGDGTKIRGLRANYIIADEFASIPEEIFNLVVRGFAVVASSPVQKMKEAARIRKLKAMGAWSDELAELQKERGGNNQVIYSGTAYYSFNHFYKYFRTWHNIIESRGDPSLLKELFGEDKLSAKGFNWKDYAIIRLPYTHVPEGMLDDTVLAQSKANLSRNQFLMEFGATFAADSDGFYRRSVIEAATTNKPIMIGGKAIQFSASREGSGKLSYVIGVDPAADQDNAAIVVLELHDEHRRVVNCWTTNKETYTKLKKNLALKGIEIEDDYYAYIARKIRELMRVYRTEHVIMDKNGGGTAIAEALASKKNCEPGEDPIYQVIDPEDPKPNDVKDGIHILELVAPTQEINSESNHGMLKDIQEKVLLFPLFDAIEVAKSIELDRANGLEFDTYEDVVQEIEELKSEMTTIVVTPSSISGKETFDTPAIKMEGSRKGHLRKDRYSALLYANYYARNRNKEESIVIQYKPAGGTKDTLKTSVTSNVMNKPMYTGPGLLKFAQNKALINSPRSVGFVKRRGY